jgi:hypothetical protein
VRKYHCGRCRRPHWILLQPGQSCVQVVCPVPPRGCFSPCERSKTRKVSAIVASRFSKLINQSIPVVSMAPSRWLFGLVLTQPSVSFSSGPLISTRPAGAWSSSLHLVSSALASSTLTMLSAGRGSDSAASSTRAGFVHVYASVLTASV